MQRPDTWHWSWAFPPRLRVWLSQQVSNPTRLHHVALVQCGSTQTHA